MNGKIPEGQVYVPRLEPTALYILLENTLGEWRINILKEKEEIERRLKKGKKW